MEDDARLENEAMLEAEIEDQAKEELKAEEAYKELINSLKQHVLDWVKHNKGEKTEHNLIMDAVSTFDGNDTWLLADLEKEGIIAKREDGEYFINVDKEERDEISGE